MRKSDKLKNIEKINKKLLESFEGEVTDIFDDINQDIGMLPTNEIHMYLDKVINYCNKLKQEYND
jgi:hypothetical protein